MAGRLLPIALATIAGIGIGVASFDSEFKELRKKRLEEEYKRDLEAAALAKGGSTPPGTEHVAIPRVNRPSPTGTEEKSSRLSSMFGLWAWERGGSPGSTTATKEAQGASSTGESKS